MNILHVEFLKACILKLEILLNQQKEIENIETVIFSEQRNPT